MDESTTLFESFPAEISDIIVSLVGDVALVIMTNVCLAWKTIILKSFCERIITKNKFINHAAKMGYLDIIKWARENNCCWDSSTCSSAAEMGYLDIIKWVKGNGCQWDSSTCSSAALGGHLEATWKY